MGVTIKDVALRARVSIASVSRALHGTGPVTEKTRLRVERAAQQLRYTPHVAARSLITRRTHTIGVLLPDIFGEYFSELIRGIDRVARQKGLHLLVTSSHGDAAEASAALRAMHGRVDGVLVMSPHVDSRVVGAALPDSLPCVLLNTPEATASSAAFVIDDFGGARQVVEHLLALGYRRMVHISGPEGNYEAAERLRGFRETLKAAPVPPPVVLSGDFTKESGDRAGREIATHRPLPEAIFAANDIMAVGCLQALREAGLRVPEDIALVGFDDIPMARYVTPPLTTVRAQITELGQQALENLLSAIENPAGHQRMRHLLTTQLVVRSSCGTGVGKSTPK